MEHQGFVASPFGSILAPIINKHLDSVTTFIAWGIEERHHQMDDASVRLLLLHLVGVVPRAQDESRDVAS
jgi:hypothetical protein